MEKRKCSCGCGEDIIAFDNKGRPRKFVRGHGLKKQLDDPLPKRKFCSRCRRTRVASKFYIRRLRSKIGGGQYIVIREWCKDCDAKYQRIDRPKRNKWKREYRRKRFGGINHHVQERISQWRKKTKGSDLTVSYLIDLYNKQRGYCYYTGIKMKFAVGRACADSLSVDRVNPKRGYMKGNIVFCTYFANTAKGVLNQVKFYKFCESVIHHIDKARNARGA